MKSTLTHALQAAQAFGVRGVRESRAIAASAMFYDTYNGAELRPCQDRPSAMQASALPSRRGNHLRWPDGRLTDLHGAPVQPPESHYTAPTFTQPCGMPVAPLRPISAPAAPVSTRFTTDLPTRKNSTLTADDVLNIRRLYAGGVNRATIAAKYGIGKTTVSNITLRKTWADVK